MEQPKRERSAGNHAEGRLKSTTAQTSKTKAEKTPKSKTERTEKSKAEQPSKSRLERSQKSKSERTPKQAPQAQGRVQKPAHKNVKHRLPERTKSVSRWKLSVCIAGGISVIVLLLYLGISFYFRSHFFTNTTINGLDFSGKTLADANHFFRSQIEGYLLNILEKDNGKDSIQGSDISLEYQESKELESVLKKQNIFSWPASFFSERTENISFEFRYDEAKLEQKINSIKAVSAEQIPPESAYPEFDGNQFVIHEETYGTAVNKDLVREKIIAAVMELAPEVDLEKENCYNLPKYTSESEKLQQACAKMNQYCQASITYQMDVPVTIDKGAISSWISSDEEMNVHLDEDAIKKWLEEFGDKYDTVGSTRTFTTPNGKEATVTGGTYGWSIEEDIEFSEIKEAIENGKTVTKEPACYAGGTAASHAMPDWGNTYAEVDLTQQHMWYVSNGTVSLETDIISGEPIPERITPEGVYSILEKKLKETLVGAINPSTGQPEYRTPVDYWMRITWEGVGFHDADWQSAFGGTLYQIHNIGSHGCINMPVDQAAALYDLIEVGVPVIIHY